MVLKGNSRARVAMIWAGLYDSLKSDDMGNGEKERRCGICHDPSDDNRSPRLFCKTARVARTVPLYILCSIWGPKLILLKQCFCA